jgi:GH15 family glucan-1,4-alpha-glucosidase
VSNVDRHPPIADYALIGDCHSAALVSRAGSIDWCCLPRFDSGSTFARLLDWERGGWCQVAPAGNRRWEITRRYLEDSLVLETSFSCSAGAARLVDCFVMREGAEDASGRQILRTIEGQRGSLEFAIRVAPRFDYGEVRPWIRRHGHRFNSAIGGNDALLVFSEQELEEDRGHELVGRATVGPGDRVHLWLAYQRPELVDEDPAEPDSGSLDRALEQTLAWWRRWARTMRLDGQDRATARRSGLMLKAMTHAPTGAIVAAPTTSLPETQTGERNWDYRYAWVRDSSFSSRAFAEIGCDREADAFRAFVMRSAAGHAEDLQVVYGVGGERRLGVSEARALRGYRGAAPVRIGNGAASQRQLDAYGELVNLTYRWHRRGHSPTDDDWRFLVSLIDHAASQWQRPDRGIWEWAGRPEHFVHSKVLCWSALEHGIRLAEECVRKAPIRRWTHVRDELRAVIERRGFDHKRGTYVQTFDSKQLDAALLLLPTVEFVDWRDERMVGTVAAVRGQLDAGNGLLYRYRRRDGLPGREGAFLCCSFWLAECLARQGELSEARAVFDQAVSTANDLGLFSEEVDPDTGELLGNFPQALTHLSHIAAAVALADGHTQR